MSKPHTPDTAYEAQHGYHTLDEDVPPGTPGSDDQTSGAGASGGETSGGGHEVPHALPVWMLAGVLVLLLVLTYLTVAVTKVDLGPANIWVALAIAVVKAALVGAVFMHLYWDAPFNGFVLLASFAFLAIFIGFSLIDTKQYRPLETAPPSAVKQVAPAQ